MDNQYSIIRINVVDLKIFSFYYKMRWGGQEGWGWYGGGQGERHLYIFTPAQLYRLCIKEKHSDVIKRYHVVHHLAIK